MKRILIAAAIVSLILSGCAKSSSSAPCTYDPCSLVAPSGEVSQLESYLAGAGINALKHCSGMYYKIKTAGSGATPTACSNVAIYYKGSLTNGTVFEDASTVISSFPLATLIEGWRK